LSHGWNSAGKEFADDFVKAYFTHKNQGYNVIAINWERLATWDNYFGAASNALKVGKHSAQVLGHLLIEQIGQDPSLIHAIGHSLGGHLVGHFGRNIESIFGKGKIARVTALDPAGPWFDVTAVSNRVAKTDADFVDVIHTNSGSLLNLCLSLKEPLGHIDFYPNGGSHQAGCNDVCLAELCTESNLMDLFRGACSHGRVVDLYVESILHAPHVDVFLSKSCEDWNQYEDGNCQDEIGEIEMGEGLTRNDVEQWSRSNEFKGTFYLETNSEPPFTGINMVGRK